MIAIWRIRTPLRVTLFIRSFGMNIVKKHDPNIKKHLYLGLKVAFGLVTITIITATIHGYIHHYSILSREEKLCGHQPVIISIPQTSWFSSPADISTPSSSSYPNYSKYNPIKSGVFGLTIGSMTCTLQQAQSQNPGAQVDP